MASADFRDELRRYCLAKPEAWEDAPWGHPVFKIGNKLFAGMSGEGTLTCSVKASPQDREGLLALPFITVAAYVGRYGWVTVTVETAEALDLLLKLIDTSYDLVSRRRKK